MRRLIKALFVLFLIFFVLVISISILFRFLGRRIEQNTIIEVELKGDIMEEMPSDFKTQLLLGRRLTLSDMLETLESAKRDGRVSGLILKISDFDMGMAKIQELRDKIKEFRSAGKWATAFMETAGEGYGGNSYYYLATACDEIYLQPSGDLNLIGLLAESTFYRGTLDKLGIYPDLDNTGEYKTYKNKFTEKAFTPAHREQAMSLLESEFEQMVSGIAEGRKILPDDVRRLIDEGPFSAEEALKNKLVDQLVYVDEYYEVMKKRNRDTLPKISPEEYMRRVGSGLRGAFRPKIALVYGIGDIHRGESSFSPLSADQSMGSDTIAKMIKTAREDKSIRAVVFRVDSPGGSGVASDVIWREVMLTKKTKPFIVSMSDVAGSGGYWVAMGADKIVAQPGTFTGSIGVVGGKLNMRGFYNNWLGVTKDWVQKGRHADLTFDYQNFTDEEKQIYQQKFLQRVYTEFVHKVAQSRNMSDKDVDAVGRGRVWTGEQAKKIGLVDELGGIDRAILLAKEKAGIAKEADVEIVKFPSRKSWLQQIFGFDAQAGIKVPSEIARLLKLLRQLKTMEHGDRLLRMPFEYEIR